MIATLSAVGSVSASRSVRLGRFYCTPSVCPSSKFQPLNKMKSTEVLNPRRTLQWLWLHDSYNTSPKLCRNGALWSILYYSYTFCRAVGSGAAGAAWAAPLFWPLTSFDYERAGGLHQQGTTRTLLSCRGSVELLCLSSETRSRSVLGLRGRNQSHPFFSARTLSYVSESVDTL